MPESLALNEEHINHFAQELSLFEQRSESTVGNYLHVIRSLLNFLNGREATTETVRKFLQAQAKTKAKSTQALWVAALRTFFRWARKKDLVTTRALENCLHAPKRSQRLFQVLDEEDLFILHKYLDNCSHEEQLLFELFYSSGLRFSEALTITRAQLDASQKQLRIVGKGRKLRLVPASDKALQLLHELLPLNPSEPLWSSRDETRLRQMVARWGKDCNLEEHCGRLHPHKLRHSIATHLVRRGAPLPKIQKFLGHSELATTQRYTHLNIEDLMRVYDRAFPENMKTSFEEKKK